MALCIDKCRYLAEIVEDFHSQGFEVKYNTDMELLTIRGYTKAQLKEFAEAEGVYMTQRSRKVLRILRKL
jgi:aspartate kinase